MKKNEKSEQQLNTLLQNNFQNYKIEYFSTIDSTNTYAKNLLEKNLNQNLIVVADSQTAGRGRMGRSFYSPDASGLYFSLTIDLQNKNITPSQITAFSGVEVCNTIKEFFNIESKIKWINDIFINNKKVCGILAEGIIDYTTGKIAKVVLGIGINLYKSKKDFPQEIQNIAGTVLKKEISEQTKIEFTAKLIQNIICFFKNPTENQLQKKLEEYKKLSFLIGKQVQVFPIIDDAKSSYTATVLDIDNNANLVVQTEGKTEVLNSGEVSLKIQNSEFRIQNCWF